MMKENKRKFKLWNNKKIALVAILIATSVSFVLVFSRLIPLAAIPSFKIMIAGLPIKLTGYIFGPIVGALTGVVSDLVSFAFLPTFIYWWYTLAFACAGFIPGLIGYIYHRRWKYKGEKNPNDEIKYNTLNFVITIGIIISVMALITGFVFSSLPDFSQSLIKNRWGFYGVVISGSGSMLIATIVMRFILKPKTFNALLPIIAFSAILDIINTPLVTLGDIASFQVDKNFLTLLTGHTILTPFKSWGNMFIIYFAYRIVSPLIFSKTSNSWNEETVDLKLKNIDKEKMKLNSPSNKNDSRIKTIKTKKPIIKNKNKKDVSKQKRGSND